MVRGRYNRITRTVGLALAALFTLAAPLATSDAQAADAPAKTESVKTDKTDKAAVKADKSAVKVDKAPTKKAKKRGKTAKQDVATASAKKPRTATKPTKKSPETTTVSTTNASTGTVVQAKPATTKSAGQTVQTSTKKPATTAPTKDKPQTTKKAPKEAKETTTASSRAASTSKKASARAPGAKRKTGKKSDGDSERPPCSPTAVAIDRNGLENESIALVDCKGKPLDVAREKLSILARPWGTPRPVIEPPKKTKKAVKRPIGKDKLGETTAENGEIAPNVRLLDAGLLTRIDSISRHFSGKHISVVSGYRPRSRGSLHQSARAIDLRVAGVSNEEVVAFCKTITDTGCGYYPNSSFVHVDVRAPGTGSVSWIDASGPGETPRYVSVWPPPPEQKAPDADVHDGATLEGIEDEVMRDATKPVSTTSDAAATPSTTTAIPKVTKEADPKDPVPGAPTNASPAKPDAAPKDSATPPAAPPAAPPAK